MLCVKIGGQITLLAVVAAGVAHAESSAPASRGGCGRQQSSLDAGWRFHLGEAAGSEQPSASEGEGWEPVTLPHDWAIHAPFVSTNPSGGAGAFATMGIGWYRLHLPTPAASCAARTFVQFDGIMANSDVWLNGHLLGHRPNGYVTLRYDLTPYLTPAAGADNVLAVRADNSQQPSSRFYQGAGLYRHVHLLRVPDLHFAAWGTAVTTPGIDSASADVQVSAELRNDSSASENAALRVLLIDATGRAVAHSATSSPVPVAPGSTVPVTVTLKLPHPHLWNLDDPAMYTARVELVHGKRSGDAETIPFGVRDAHFEAATGFWLNGKNIKIKGVALHSDIGALGMAAPLSLWEHRLRAMQQMGANAVRTAHNPVAPEFLALCDRLGILVLDEFFDCWTVGKNPFDFHLYFRDWYLQDTRDTVRRDRNHPSVIAWSAGNEIHDTPHPEIAKPILAALVAEYHKDDPTRPVTQALFRPNVSHDYDNGLADELDVIGQNYRPAEILAAHDANPARKIIGTENGHDRAQWLAVRDHPAYAGMFLWSGTDYLGESRRWPVFAESEGMNDRTDFPKPDSLERASWWAEHPVVHLARRVAPVPKAPTDPGYETELYRPKQTAFPDWTPLNLSPHPEHVEVYSNCQEVSLRLNGEDLGAKPIAPDAAPRTWEVPFAPGSIEARCTDQPGTSETLQTAGAPAALRLRSSAKRLGAGFDDVLRVEVTVVDARGVAVPGAQVPVHFLVSGAGVLLATDTAEYTYSEPFSSPERTTYDGRAVAYLRGSGKGTLQVRAEAPGLRPAQVEVTIDGALSTLPPPAR